MLMAYEDGRRFDVAITDKNRKLWTERERGIALEEYRKADSSVQKAQKIIEMKYGFQIPLPTLYKWINGRKAGLKTLDIPSDLQERADFWYMVGVLHGDGHVSYHKSSGILSMAVKDLSYAQFLVGIIKGLFGYEPRIRTRPDCSYVEVYTKGIVDIFSRFKRVGYWVVPEAIYGFPGEWKASYIRGLFDTDGHVAFYPRNDVYGRADRGIILNIDNTDACLGVQKLLETIGIRSRYYLVRYKKDGRDYKIDRLTIKNRAFIERFADVVGFSHPEKSKTVGEMLKSYKDGKPKYFDTKELILGLLRGGELPTLEIAKKLDRSVSTVMEHLVKLEKEKKVKRNAESFNRWGVCKKSRYKRYLWRMA
jgi:intein-encoded DNA endonuclease-like protein